MARNPERPGTAADLLVPCLESEGREYGRCLAPARGGVVRRGRQASTAPGSASWTVTPDSPREDNSERSWSGVPARIGNVP